ncbi:MAG TPA: hypothetical protein VFX79_02750 [Candidatus Saccharimonadales bacterium]|nr:hypothetical protein [Candidatus Saccharimonadales bacterium]
MSIKKIATSLVTASAVMVLALTSLVGSAGATVPPSIEGGDIYYGKNLTKNTSLGDPISAEPCDTILYKVRIHNPGPTETLKNVTVQATFGTEAVAKNVSIVTVRASNAQPTNTSDTATVNISSPQKLTYISGSSELLDHNSNFIKNISDVTEGSGVHIGDIGVSINQKRFVQFKAKINCPQKPPCEDNPETPEDECNPCVDNPETPGDECNPQPPKEQPPQKPKSLPNTGPAAVFTTFLGVSSISALLHRLFARRQS